MAKLMLQPYNLLALDEPTNHMDIKSKDILKQALKAYDGTLIVVSHDRDFLDGLVDKLYEFRDGQVKEFLGSVQEFLDTRRLENLQELERRFQPVAKLESEKTETAAKQEYNQRKSVSKEERKLRSRVDFLEKEITKTETRMKEIEKVLSAPGPDDDVIELTRSYLECKRDADAWTAEWEDLMLKIG